MATVRREYVLITFLLSCVALVLLIVALATNWWISSDVQPTNTVGESLRGEANYGLLSGSYRKIGSAFSSTLQIAIVCDFGENACVWSCEQDSDKRKEDLQNLLQGTPIGTTCNQNRALKKLPRSTPILIKNENYESGESSAEKRFINAGLWLCTFMTLILAMIASAVTAVLSVINTASNPVYVVFAIEGLYYWNGAAAALDLLCLIFWGSQFAVTLKDNIAVYDTAVEGQNTSNGLANLGWSYWMVLVALLLNLINIGLLFFRDYMLKKEPPPPTYNPETAAADGTLFLY